MTTLLLAIFVAASVRDPVPVEKRAWDGLAQAAELRAAGRDRDAELVLRRIIALPEPAYVAGMYNQSPRFKVRDARTRAQQQIGEIQLARGEYAEALQAFRSRQLIPSGCGNGNEQQVAEAALWQGACLEGLGQTRDAVALY